MHEIIRGQIFKAEIRDAIGNEIGGIRPVLIVQNNISNKYAPTVIVAPITTRMKNVKIPTHVALPKEHSNLGIDSIILLEQVQTLDKKRLKEMIGFISDEMIMKKVSDAWMILGGLIPINDKQEKFIGFYRYILNSKVDLIEDYNCEFKEVKGKIYKNIINSTVASYSASFLNSKGGSIYYGIADDRTVKGVNISIDDRDKINQIVYNNIANIEPSISPDYFEIEYHPVYSEKNEKIKDVYVIEVMVPISPNKNTIYFVKGTELYIRVNGVRKKLIGNQIVSYIQKRLLD